MIEFLCPHCGNRLALPEQYAGQSGACSHCEEPIEVPMESEDLPKPEMGAQPEGPPPLSLANRSSGLAVTSVVLSAVAYFGLTIFTAIPGIVTGHLAVRRAKEEPEYYGGRAIAWVGILLGYLHVLLFCVGVGFLVYRAVTAPSGPRFGRGPAQTSVAMCQNNLKQLGLVMKMFANESKGEVYPLLSSAPGKLMFETFEIYPEYLTDPNVLCCPSTGINYSQQAGANLDDQSYYYLGYVFTSDSEVEAFAGAYMKRLAKGDVFDEDFDAPQGKGSGGSDTFYRLREGVELMVTPPAPPGIGVPPNPAMVSGTAQAIIPVMIERPGHHQQRGSNVLFMDGHVEFIAPGTWPVTDKTMRALQKMDDFSGLTSLELETLVGGQDTVEEDTAATPE